MYMSVYACIVMHIMINTCLQMGVSQHVWVWRSVDEDIRSIGMDFSIPLI